MKQIAESKNKKNLDRLVSILDPEGNVALSALWLVESQKKESNEEFDKKISDYRNRVVTSIGKKLYKIAEPSEFQTMLFVDVVDRENPYPLLHSLIESTFNMKINSENEREVFSETTLINVKIESLRKIGIENFEQCQKACEEITELWKGFASIGCFDTVEKHDRVQFHIDLSGFISE